MTVAACCTATLGARKSCGGFANSRHLNGSIDSSRIAKTLLAVLAQTNSR